MKKNRLDTLLVEQGYFADADEALRAVLAHEVKVNDVYATSAAVRVAPDAEVVVKNRKRFVSRGGHKLQGARRCVRQDVRGLRCLDIGSSTGGFSDCLLQAGAASVACVDVNYGQLAWKLRQDPRVSVFERVNIKLADPVELGAPFDVLVADLSFIGLAALAPVFARLSQPGTVFIGLVKPQFESRPDETERGVVMDGDKAEHLLEAIPVMGSYCDVIGVRSFARFRDKTEDYEERVLEQFIRYSGRPVFSMEAATRHPLQSFADLITIEEHKRTERPKVVMTWAPHPNALPQAVPNSFAEWMNAAGYDFVITHPEGYELDPRFVGSARVEYDQRKALEGADFVYAKNWAAYADPNYGKVLSRDRAWTVDREKMALTNDAFFMHCLPVRRNMIVTDEVIESPRSLVIPEAANREISAQVVLKRLLEGLA